MAPIGWDTYKETSYLFSNHTTYNVNRSNNCNTYSHLKKRRMCGGRQTSSLTSGWGPSSAPWDWPTGSLFSMSFVSSFQEVLPFPSSAMHGHFWRELWRMSSSLDQQFFQPVFCWRPWILGAGDLFISQTVSLKLTAFYLYRCLKSFVLPVFDFSRLHVRYIWDSFRDLSLSLETSFWLPWVYSAFVGWYCLSL